MTDKNFLSIGDIFEVTIEKICQMGDGLAKVDQFVFLIPDTNEGERVKIKITKCANLFGFAKVIARINDKKD